MLNKYLYNSRQIFPGITYINGLRHVSGPGNNFKVKETLENRNPRNLQLMLLERKPKGFQLDQPSREYWYKLNFEITSRNIHSEIIHNTGTKVVTANSSEWAINKHLRSNKSLDSVQNIARVLAQRCLETGIYFVHFETPNEKSPKLKLFLNVLEEEGLKIGELGEIKPKTRTTL